MTNDYIFDINKCFWQLLNDIGSIGKRGGTEKYPGKGYQHEGGQLPENIIQGFETAEADQLVELFPWLLGNQGKYEVETMERTPNKESPVGTMPETAQEEYDK